MGCVGSGPKPPNNQPERKPEQPVVNPNPTNPNSNINASTAGKKRKLT